MERPDLPGKLMVDFGLNVPTSRPDNFSTIPLQSKSFGLHYVREFFLNNNISASIGAGLGAEKLSFRNGNVISRNEDSVLFRQSTVSLDKSKLGLNYLQVPVDIRYYPKGEGKGSRFFVGAGFYAGYLFMAQTKIVYPRNANISKEKTRGDFGVNPFRFGITGKLGFDSFHFIGKFDLTQLFESSNMPLDGNANLWSFGIAVDTF